MLSGCHSLPLVTNVCPFSVGPVRPLQDRGVLEYATLAPAMGVWFASETTLRKSARGPAV